MIVLLLADLISPVVLFFLSGRNGLKRCEESVIGFFWALREKYPRGYVNQNKVIKFVRKCFGMDTQHTIHWVTCFLHYLQIGMLVSPLVMLLVFAFIPTENVIGSFLIGGIALPFGLLWVLSDIFMFIQLARCKKIKKTDPKYAKREVHLWSGGRIGMYFL